MALIVGLMAMLLLSALGAATVMTTSAETLIAANFRNAQEGLYAADAALELAAADLATRGDWNAVLDGSTRSLLVDGPPGGSRTLAEGLPLDLGALVNMTNCRRTPMCSATDLTAMTAQRPWGANNPVWRLFLYGALPAIVPGHPIQSSSFVVVMVADDPAETDNDPLRDGDTASNGGSGVLVLRAEAFGPGAAHQAIEATIRRRRGDVAGARLLSWRQVR
jgi:type IV pilus assembly PilX-like protein